jgi:transcriptional regulator with XRE-family HTH domain
MKSNSTATPLGHYSTFGARLRVAIKRAETTQSQLARDLGVAQPSLNIWVNDKGMPSSKYIKPLSEALDVSADWLLDVDPPEKDDDELDPVDHLIRHSLKQTATDLDEAINRLERITGRAPISRAEERRRNRQKPPRIDDLLTNKSRLAALLGNDKSTVWSDDDV